MLAPDPIVCSCVPNCSVRFMFEDSGPLLQFVAVKKVCPGDELCHSYVDLALGTDD